MLDHEIVLALRENCPACKLHSADRSVEWKSTSDLPSDEKELKKQMQYKEYRISMRKTGAVFSMYFESDRKIKQHRLDNQALLTLLEREIIYLSVRTLGSSQTSVLGWLAKIHPRATHYQTLEAEILSALRKTTPDPL